MSSPTFTLSILSDHFAISKLSALDDVPAWAQNSKFSSVTRTDDELSIFSLEKDVPDGIKTDGQWRALKVKGPLEFSQMGIFSVLTPIIEESKIPLCVISTFDTDYLLVKSDRLEDTTNLLKAGGHSITE